MTKRNVRRIEIALLVVLAVVATALVVAQIPNPMTPKVAEAQAAPIVVEVQRLSDAAWIAIMTMIGSVIATLASLFVSLSNAKKITSQGGAIDQIHTLTNSSLS